MATGLRILAVLALLAVAKFAFPAKAEAGDGKWAEVCCGTTCIGGEPYCAGVGEYTCCR